MTRFFSLMITLTLFGALLSACESDGGGTYDPNAQPTAAIEAVSYTHLTLPTICSV